MNLARIAARVARVAQGPREPEQDGEDQDGDDRGPASEPEPEPPYDTLEEKKGLK